MNLQEGNNRQLLDRLGRRLLEGWKAGEGSATTARALFRVLPSPFRSVVVQYISSQGAAAINRVAMLSPEVRQIMGEGSGEDWMKAVFHEMEVLSQ